jgi:Tfp pilus assembly protein PilF
MLPSLFACFCTQEPIVNYTAGSGIGDQNEEGEADDNRSMARRSEMADSYLQLAQEFYAKNLISDAIDCLEYAIRLNRDSSPAHLLLGIMHHHQGELLPVHLMRYSYLR